MRSTGAHISRSILSRSASVPYSSSCFSLLRWTCKQCRYYGKGHQRWRSIPLKFDNNSAQRRLFSAGNAARSQASTATVQHSQPSNVKTQDESVAEQGAETKKSFTRHGKVHKTRTRLRVLFHSSFQNDEEERSLDKDSGTTSTQDVAYSNRPKLRLSYSQRRGLRAKRLIRKTSQRPETLTKAIQSARVVVASSDMLLRMAAEKMGESEDIIRMFDFNVDRVDFLTAQDQSSASLETNEDQDISQDRVFNEKDLFKSHKYELLFRARDIKERVVDVPMSKPPRLHHGLDRVLFNPGVYHLRNQRTGVFNFDPDLERIEPVTSFQIEAMSSFTTPSEDKTLAQTAIENGCKYSASTSSSTNLLKHLHFVLSNARPLNDTALSKGFETSETRFFTNAQKKPSSVFLRFKKGENGEEGHYSIDSDSHLDSTRELSLTGVLLEKLLTSTKGELEKYRVGSSLSEEDIEDQSRKSEGSYHYTAYGRILVRSQLDAYDPRLPGSGIFDLKTRACAAVRLDWEERSLARTSNYQLRDNLGLWESYEREQFDLMRTAMLKYSLQVRLGRMDGIFVAYHNTAKMFGFQYMPLEDMDFCIHGQRDRSLGDQELAMSMQLLEEILERATKRFPEQTLWIHFDTRFFKAGPFLRIFVEPISDEQCDRLKKQSKERRKKSLAAESSLSMMAAESPTLSTEELIATKETAEQLAGSATTLIRTMEENRLANLAELAELGYQEDQILNMLKSYFEVIRTMESFAASPPSEGDEEEALKFEAETITAINAALTECQPLVDLFPEQRHKAQSILKSEILGKPDLSNSSLAETQEPEEPEEAYLKTHEPSELAAYELRVVNYVSGYGFVERPTRVFGDANHRRLSVRASLKEVEDPKAAKRTYDIMRRSVLNTLRGADRFYEGWFFSNLLRLSESGRRWAENQERRHKGREVVRFEPFDGA